MRSEAKEVNPLKHNWTPRNRWSENAMIVREISEMAWWPCYFYHSLVFIGFIIAIRTLLLLFHCNIWLQFTSYIFVWHTGFFTELVHRKAMLSCDVQLTPLIRHGKGKHSFLLNVVTCQILHQEMSNFSLQAEKNCKHHTDLLIDIFTFVIHRFSTDVTTRPIPKFHSTKLSM